MQLNHGLTALITCLKTGEDCRINSALWHFWVFFFKFFHIFLLFRALSGGRSNLYDVSGQRTEICCYFSESFISFDWDDSDLPQDCSCICGEGICERFSTIYQGETIPSALVINDFALIDSPLVVRAHRHKTAVVSNLEHCRLIAWLAVVVIKSSQQFFFFSHLLFPAPFPLFRTFL